MYTRATPTLGRNDRHLPAKGAKHQFKPPDASEEELGSSALLSSWHWSKNPDKVAVGFHITPRLSFIPNAIRALRSAGESPSPIDVHSPLKAGFESPDFSGFGGPACRHVVSGSFPPLVGVLFTFRSRYLVRYRSPGST